MTRTTRVCLRDDPFCVNCARPSVLGNPFRMRSRSFAERARVIRLHRKWMIEKLRSEPLFRKYVLSLEGLALGCFCPEGSPCHVDNYIDFIEGRIQLGEA